MPRLSGSSWDSLERKLPILIGGLVVVSVLVTFAIVRLELRESAVDGASERLARVGQQLADLANTSARQRHELLRSTTADPVIVAAARGETVVETELLESVERLRAPADSLETILLVGRDGRVLASPGSAGSIDVAPAGIALTNAITYSPLHRSNGRAAFWTAAPVADGAGVVHGHLVQRRSFGSPSTRQQVESLVGARFSVSITNPDGSARVLLDGTLLDDTVRIPVTGEPFERIGSDGVRHYSYAVPLASGYIMLTELPLQTVIQRATHVTRRLLVVGALLLLLGGIAAWMVSRSVSAPLRRLASAADAIAAGDYSRRTGLERTDEIGHLARSFDAMAGYVDVTHAELAHRFEEARRLARELEGTNARLQQAVAELELARTAAQAANAAKSEFLATMSHEIRTPINAMVGYTDLLELGVPGPLNEQQLEYVDRIRRSGEHLIAVVNDVLDFAKLESGQMRVRRDVIPAGIVLVEAVAMMQARATSRGVVLRHAGPTDATLIGDRQRLNQIMLNLLSNAIKFTPEQGTVTVSCERRSSRVHPPAGDGDAADWTCLVVEDTGVGIPPEQRDTIFEPFVQGTAGYTRPHGGTGLGLAISRSLARMMGGDLTVESEPGRGARFTVWLPVGRAASQSAA